MTRRKTNIDHDDGSSVQLDLQLAELTAKERLLKEMPDRIRREKIESEMTIPPCEELEERKRARRHEELIVTRGQVQNAVREHDRSLLLLILLVACTLSLGWWAFQLMAG